MATHPKAAKEETPVIDQFKDRHIELRARTLAYLETQLAAGHMDRLEVTQKLAGILLMSVEKADLYIRTMTTNPEIWGLIVGPRSAKSKVELIAGFGVADE